MPRSPDTKGPDAPMVEVSHQDMVVEAIRRFEARGFQPVLIAFRDQNCEVEILTREIDLVEFTSWLLTRWIPSSRNRSRKRRAGH